MEFAKTVLDVKVVFDNDGKIGGLWFVPHIAASEAQYSPPLYARKERYQETEVTVGQWKLPGTLAMPVGDGPFPRWCSCTAPDPTTGTKASARTSLFATWRWAWRPRAWPCCVMT